MEEEGWEDLGLKLSAQKVVVTLNMARMCVDLKVAGLMLQIMGPLTPLPSHLASVKCHTPTHNTTSAPPAAAKKRSKHTLLMRCNTRRLHLQRMPLSKSCKP